MLSKDVTRKDEHKLKLAQLDWELIERQKYSNFVKFNLKKYLKF